MTQSRVDYGWTAHPRISRTCEAHFACQPRETVTHQTRPTRLLYDDSVRYWTRSVFDQPAFIVRVSIVALVCLTNYSQGNQEYLVRFLEAVVRDSSVP